MCHPMSKVLVECWGYQPSLSQCRSHRHQMKYQEYLASSFAKVLKILEVVCMCTNKDVSEGRWLTYTLLREHLALLGCGRLVLEDQFPMIYEKNVQYYSQASDSVLTSTNLIEWILYGAAMTPEERCLHHEIIIIK